MSYCEYINSLPDGERKALNKKYHDVHYGFPLHNDDELFGRLLLEINQAGLSWEIILKKADNFRRAYDDFQISKIAAYGEQDFARLMSDAGIIRNRLKINAAIENAKIVVELQKQCGSFENWLAVNSPKTRDEWTKLFKKTFKFTGGEIVNEFFMSIGFLEGAHDKTCPVYQQILKLKPMWAKQK